jgi:acyl carrier protein
VQEKAYRKLRLLQRLFNAHVSTLARRHWNGHNIVLQIAGNVKYIGIMTQSAFEPAAICTWCIGVVAEMLEESAADIHPDSKFSRLGFDSTMSVELAVAIEEQFGLRMDLDVIADHPTISRLAAYVAAQYADKS